MILDSATAPDFTTLGGEEGSPSAVMTPSPYAPDPYPEGHMLQVFSSFRTGQHRLAKLNNHEERRQQSQESERVSRV